MFKLILEPQFGSTHENYRLNIRKHIIDNQDLTDEEKINILDLNQLPKSKKYYFSISHCKSIGGYAVSSQPIGFDIEDIDRISRDIVKRITTLDLVPEDPRWLWPAKESILKLTSAPLVSDCHVIKWDKDSFTGLFDHKKITGSIRILEKHIWAVAFFKT